jgi:hypothetical protein
MSDEHPEQPELPIESYRDLLQAKANGFEVDEYQLAMWRREEELVRSATYHAAQYRGCGVRPVHFDAPMHSLAWQAITKLLGDPQCKVIEGSVLLSEMRELDEDMAGGARGRNWISHLMSERPIPPRYGLETLVNEIRQKHTLEQWKGSFQQLCARVGRDKNVAMLQSDFVRKGIETSLEAHGNMAVKPPATEKPWDAKTVEKGSLVKLGIQRLDRVAGGGHGIGELMAVGGGTNIGKSYFARELWCLQGEQGNRALYVSCEDPEELMYCRTWAGYSSPPIAPVSIREKKADPEVVEQARMMFREKCGDRVFIEEMKKPTIDEVCFKLRTYAYAQDVKTAIVDYLQAITDPEVTNGNKVQEVSSIISKLKRCATECGVALIVFSQLARDEYRDGTEPGLNSMKYCGDIENEAELVVLMWRDGEGVLHVKVPKVKWTNSRGARFIVDIDEVTGCFVDWRDDLSAPTERETKGGPKSASASS